MTVVLKSFSSGRYWIELFSEIRYGQTVYTAAIHETSNGADYRTIQENTTTDRRNAMATYRRYIKKIEQEVEQ